MYRYALAPIDTHPKAAAPAAPAAKTASDSHAVAAPEAVEVATTSDSDFQQWK